MIASSESSLVPAPSQCSGPHGMTPGLCPDYPHSPSASKPVGQHMGHTGTQGNSMTSRGSHQSHQWDINDSTLPVTEAHDSFELWPSGHYRRVYRGDSDDARRHVSGWAMRNTNNHNALILKKSCLGVLVCSLDCLLDSGRKVHLRPAICDKARRKQIGKPCPNPGCQGKLTLLSCRGHCGYPVTHFWRHVNNSVFFQAKGYHDHPRPEVKSLSDKGRHAFSKQLRQDGERIFSMPTKRRFPVHTSDDDPERKIYIPSGEEVMCSCPPFECVCPKSAQTKNTFMPSAFGFIRDSPSHTYLPHRSPSVSGLGMEQLTHGPFTQINITNTCLPAPGLEVSIPGIDIYKNCSKFAPHSYYHDNDMKIFRYGSGEVINNPLPHGQHFGRSPMDDLRSPQVANCPSSAGLQHMNSMPRNFSSSAGTCNQPNIYINDGRDDYSRYRINPSHCYNKGRGMAGSLEDRSHALGLSLKTEPTEHVFRDMPSSPHGGQTRNYHPESMYNSVSPSFNSHSMLSPKNC
ncbi:unnamed protein product [Candidula unifasciata]|uniref:GCM domain-containing protein n=1 Tax=Candidula unifasciata TaxID=100452 RepID=A0A8S3ZFC6_9EUPU|nr:unnamed protein product [Candidula unifasciata]